MKSMNIKFSATFKRHFSKLSRYEKELALEAIDLFQLDPYDPSLRNHSLHDTLSSRRAISANHDLRIIFYEKNNYKEITIIDVGTHSTVY